MENGLPLACINRIVKNTLEEIGSEGGGITKDGKQCFAQATNTFVLYLTSMANDRCMKAKRQTMLQDDVLKALKDIGMDDITSDLEEFMTAIRSDAKTKRAKISDENSSSSQNKQEKNYMTEETEDNSVGKDAASDKEINVEPELEPKQQEYVLEINAKNENMEDNHNFQNQNQSEKNNADDNLVSNIEEDQIEDKLHDSNRTSNKENSSQERLDIDTMNDNPISNTEDDSVDLMNCE